MMLAIHATAGNHAAPKSKRGHDVYLTPPCAVEAVLRVEPLPPVCWECCGDDTSAIAQVLRASGRRVACTDLAADGIDFLARRHAPLGEQCAIVINRPFSLAAAFTARALTLVRRVRARKGSMALRRMPRRSIRRRHARAGSDFSKAARAHASCRLDRQASGPGHVLRVVLLRSPPRRQRANARLVLRF